MLTLLLAALTAADAPRPNIVLILADDMGYSDLGCYGSEIDTPHLDKLAAGGLRLTQFYNTGRCCPTRASLLTGLYPHAAGVGHMMDDRGGHPGYRGDLNDRCRTIAEVLRTAGYHTGAVGKWHVTKTVDPEQSQTNWPRQRGFDHFYGIISGAASYWDPWSLTRENERISAFADPDYVPELDSPAGGPYYFTDAVTDHAVRFVQDADQKQPLFLYVAYTAAHWPMHARPRDIAKYDGAYDRGYGAIRRERLERMRSLGVIDADAELSEQAWEWGRADTAWDADLMEIYAAMVDSMDQGIGRLVDELERTGRAENTLILFCQDNGGCAEGFGRTPGSKNRHGIVAGPRPGQPTHPAMADEALIGAMVPPQTRDGYPIRGGVHAASGAADTYVAYGQGWANVSNTPFRMYKHYVHEGGISTPLIMHWPAGLKRRRELDATPTHLVDVMATCVDLADADYRQDDAIRPMAGTSLKPLMDGGALPTRLLFWEHEGNRAVRDGDWKLVAKGEAGPWELYDIGRDRSELHDLAGEHLDVVARLDGEWQSWAKRDDVLPLGRWRKDFVADAAD